MSKLTLPMLLWFTLSLVAWVSVYWSSPTGTPPDTTLTTMLVGIVGALVFGVRWLVLWTRARRSAHDV